MTTSGKLMMMVLVTTALGVSFALGRTTFLPAGGNAAAAPRSASASAQDAVVAAPRSHRILLENDRVRVLEVTVAPGEREPMHTHEWPSVMYIDQPATLLYYDGKGALRFDGRARSPQVRPVTQWMPPEGLHAVENAGTTRFMPFASK